MRRIVFLFSALALTGCGVAPNVTPAHVTTEGITGLVHGGQQPVAGATLQLYTVGTTADGSASTPLLTRTVTTDANGNFTITGLYSCTSATQVYLTATSGNPGLTTVNPNIAMMTALGPCSALTSGTFIVVNELTTVAAAYALAPYATSYTAIGSAPSDVSALASAFTLASAYVNPAGGSTPGINVPAGYTVPTTQLNTLADILASCINSPGGTAGDGSSCGQLFTLTTQPSATAPTNTLAALLSLAKNPTLNTSGLYSLTSPNAPFQPTQPIQPPDLNVRLIPPSSAVALQISPASLTFPLTEAGTTSASQPLTLLNTSSATVSLTGLSFTGPDPSDFTESSACPSALTANASCTLAVSATPTLAGSRSAYLSIASSTPASPQYVTLAATASAPSGSIDFTPTTLNLPQTAVNFTSPVQTATLTNNSTIPIYFTNFTFTGANPADFSELNNCVSPLAIGASCTFQLTATPAVLGQRTATLTALTTAATLTATLPLTVNGAAPASPTPTLSAKTLSYTTAGTIQDLTLSNLAATPLTIASITSSDPTDFPIYANTCGISLPAQSTCTISIKSTGFGDNSEFNIAQTYSATLTLDDDAASGPQTVALASNNAEDIYNDFTFPAIAVGSSESQTVQVVGATHETTASAFGSFSGGNASDFSPSPTGCTGSGNVPGSQACTFSVTFTPSASGTRTTRYVLYNSNEYIPVTGTTTNLVTGPAFTATAPYLQALLNASNSASASAPLVIANTGSTSLDLQVASLTSANPSLYTVTGNCSTIPAQGTCSLNVAFAVTNATSTSFPATLVLKDQTSGVTRSVALKVSFDYSALAASPASIAVPSQVLGTTSAPLTISVTDSSGNPLNHALSAVLSSNSGFIADQPLTCPASATAPCTFSVQFSPQQTLGPYSGYLDITDAVSGNYLYVQLTGTAVPTGTPGISLSPSPLVFVARPVGSTSAALPVTVTGAGTGDAPLIISSITLNGAVNGNFTQTNNCASVANGASCTIDVTFAPTIAGAQSATITIVSNAPTSPTTLTISGSTQ